MATDLYNKNLKPQARIVLKFCIFPLLSNKLICMKTNNGGQLLPFCLISYFLLTAVAIRAQDPITIESLRSLPEVFNPQISPNGQYVLYSRSNIDIEDNRQVTNLMVFDLETNTASVLATEVSQQQWSPNGQYISFLATYGGIHGLYVAEFLPKKKKPQIDIPVFIAAIQQSNHFLGHPTKKNYAWRPDGNAIAYTAMDTASCPPKQDPNDPKIINRLLYKSRTAFSDNCYTKVFLSSSTGQFMKCLTPQPFDSHSITWSSDGENLAFVSNRTSNPDGNYNNDLWQVNVGSGKVQQLTQTLGTEHEPVWHPKLPKIAFSGTSRPINTKDSSPENPSMQTISLNDPTFTPLADDLDRRVFAPQWSSDGQWLYFLARDHGRTVLYRSIEGQSPEKVIDSDGTISQYHLGNNSLVYTMSLPGRPTEIYITGLNGENNRPLTTETFTWRALHRQAKFEDFYFKSFDGTEIHGFIAFPSAMKQQKIPVVHRIHGGPHGMYGFRFDPFNELLVSQGYAVVMINPRGSTGYGQKFTDGTYQAWGGADYKDLMAGMDAALAKYEFLDEERMAVTGGSYGGFMTNWVITQTNRYLAAITVASVSNLISFYGNSLYQLLIETEFNGFPWDNDDLLWHFSPMKHVANVQTPTLIIHGENDNDVPITQAEELYIGLKKRGVPTQFIRYPNEGHGIRQPQHREHYYQQIINWLKKYLQA